MTCGLVTCRKCGKDGCKGKYTRETVMKLHTASEVIVVSIPRKVYNQVTQMPQKNEQSIQLGGNLVIPMVNGSFAEYELIAAIQHTGNMLKETLKVSKMQK